MSELNPVKVYQGKNLRHVSKTCKIFRLPNGGVMLKFCAADMTVNLPADVVAQIRYVSRSGLRG